MDGFRILLLIIAIGILIINFFINSGNLIKIVAYSFQINSVKEYWSLFFKSSFNGRALISSLIGLVLAIIIFIIITPIILIRKSIYGEKMNEVLEKGHFFQYQDLDLENEEITYNSNINTVTGLNLKPISATGKLRIDAIIVLGELEIICKEKGINFQYKVMEKTKLVNNNDILFPLLLIIGEKEYPTYFVFNETHQKQFNNIKNELYDNGYKKCIYFSTLS